jgi:invasion protein IalB
MTRRDTGQRVFRLAFRVHESGAIETLAMAPFGVLLRDGITFSIDEGQPFASEFLACFAEGCLSRFIVPADILAALERGTMLTGAMRAYEGEIFNVQVALAGLSDGLARLRELAPQQ